MSKYCEMSKNMDLVLKNKKNDSTLYRERTKPMSHRITTAFMTSIMIVLGPALAFAATGERGQLQKTMKEQMITNKLGQNSQNKVTKTAEQTQELFDEYRRTLKQIENTKIYNLQLEKMIGNQKEEVQSISEQIVNLKQTNRDIVPLMLRMISTLEQFTDIDVPFLPEERAERIANLNKMMGRADVSTSEKYRRVLEAYQVENDYGRTLEAYRGKLNKGDKELTVDYLRVGRVSFMYQTLDSEEAGFWDQEKRSWVELPDRYRNSIKNGIKIARKQAAPDLLTLPIPAPEELK